MTKRRIRLSCGEVIAASAVLAAVGVTTAGVPAWAQQAQPPRAAVGHAGQLSAGWVGSWGAAPSAATQQLGTDAVTVRNVVHSGVGGDEVRVRLTNAFGTQPLSVTGVTVALAQSSSSAAAVPTTMTTATFGGASAVTIPVGGEVVSDPASLRVPAEHDLLVSVAVPADSGPATYHLHATQTNYVATAGDHAAKTSGSWFYVDELDVREPASRGTVVALGDSITDGVTSTAGTDRRWPDDLGRRLLAAAGPRACGVLNEGISGNRILLDGSARSSGYAAAGPSAVARLQRDVLSRTDPRTLVVFEGINDIIWPPHQLDPQAIIGGLRQIVLQAHADGIRVVGATITPAGGYSEGFDAQQEATRQAVNMWIRHSHAFDAVADFDAVLRDPANPDRISPTYDSGDHLHPNDAGYQVLADSLHLADVC